MGDAADDAYRRAERELEDGDAYHDEDEWAYMVERFADPGGTSALHAAGPDNPREYPCPNCGTENVLTRRDVAAHYICDPCADATERDY